MNSTLSAMLQSSSSDSDDERKENEYSNNELKRALQIRPNAIAFIDGEREITFAEFHQRCGKLVSALRLLGAQSGARVAILANNSSQYFEAYVGIPAGGMVVAPLNTRHAMPELVYALQDSGANILITDRADVGELADVVEHVIMLPDAYETALADVEPAELGEGVAETDLAGLFYTGGTTGASKGVMLTHRNLMANAQHWLASVPQNEQDRSLVMAPMFHAAGSNGILAAIWQGALQVPLGTFDGPAAFQSSSDAVFRWAPIADELKCDDEEILRNSIHLRWIGVRRDLKAVFQHAAIADDWQRHGATSTTQLAAK